MKPPTSPQEEGGEEESEEATLPLEYTGDPTAYLSAIRGPLSSVASQEALTILKPNLATLFVSDRAAFAVVANLIKEKLGVGRRDLNAAIKPLLDEEDDDSPPLPIARFAELVDLVTDEQEVKFLVYSGENGSEPRVETEWQINEQLYLPPAKNLIPWPLPRAEQVLAAYRNDTSAALYADLIAYYKSLSELPTDFHYDLLTAFTLHTYTLDFPEVTHSPELVFDAVPERGKSRTGKAMSHVVMRGLRTETLREANIFRWSEDLGATLFFDVLNLWKKAGREKSEDILLNRFEKGSTAARVLYPEKGPFKDTRYFDIFGATIIATNESVHKILGTRCLTISMPPAKKRYDSEPTPELGLPLRERLIAWRAHQMGKPLPEMKKSFAGRFGDITLPLLKIVRRVAPKREEALLKLFIEMEKSRLNEKSRSLEGDILIALLALEPEVANAKLPLKKLVEKLNEERADKEKVTPRFVGSRIRSLGFQLTSRNPASLVWKKELLDSCLISYGIKEPPRTPETSSQSSQQSQSSQEDESKQPEEPPISESFERNESFERQNTGHGRGYKVAPESFVTDARDDAEVLE